MSAKKIDISVCFGYSYKRNTYAIDGSDAAMVSIAQNAGGVWVLTRFC